MYDIDKEYERKRMEILRSIEGSSKSTARATDSIHIIVVLFMFALSASVYFSWRQDSLFIKKVEGSVEQACIESCQPIAFHSVKKGRCYCDPDGIVLDSWVRYEKRYE